MRRSFVPATFVLLTVCILASASRLSAQVRASAEEGGLPLLIGGGIADDNIDFGDGRRMEGIAAWVDWDLTGHKHIPKGLNLEVQGKTVRFGVPQGFSQMREDTALGGVLYSWRRTPNFRPFVKGLVGIGSIDFPPYPHYGHDTRMVMAPGAGVDYRVKGNIWLRAQYEYQFWDRIPAFGEGHLTPNGFTIGASYNFRHHTQFR